MYDIDQFHSIITSGNRIFICLLKLYVDSEWNLPVRNVWKVAYSKKLLVFPVQALYLSCVYTLRLIGAILYPGECDLMVHPRKYMQRHFLMNAFCYLHSYITCTKIQDRPQFIAVCKRSFNVPL